MQTRTGPDGRKASRINLPNKLTLARIFLVPLLMVFLIAETRTPGYAAVVVFLAAVLTDWLDGHIARATSQVTTLGKLLDPTADKLLIAAALITLVQVGRVPAWMVVVLVGRDLAVTGLRGIAAAQGLIIPASDLGKYKMGAEVVAVTLLLSGWSPLPPGLLVPPVGLLALGVAGLLALLSGVDYFLKFWRRIDLGR
jgi:CDP-diacylglycerol--glycerol-3-phosphate 3-phosphatidyltransferase